MSATLREFPIIVSRRQLAECIGVSVDTIDRQAEPGGPLHALRAQIGRRIIRYPLAEALRALGLTDAEVERAMRRRDPRKAKAAQDRARAAIDDAAAG